MTLKVAVLHDDRVEMRDSKSGQMQWSFQGATGEQLLRVAESEGEVIALARSVDGCVSLMGGWD